MNTAYDAGNEQAQLWNGLAGQAWVDAQALLDGMFRPLQDRLVEAVSASAREVLDIGCGTGAVALALARRLGAAGRCVGIDISEPMIALARTRADAEGGSAEFLCADAQTHAFAPARFDAIVSRFGVMFFADPVAAFANLRRAAKQGAELHLIAWRGAADNPFMTTAERAAAPLLPTLPARKPDGPGQFAFADAQRVRRILDDSGWAEIDIQPIEATCSFPESELVRYLSRLGPLGLFLQEADERTRAEVVKTVRAAFDPYVHGAEVRYRAACWMIGARAWSAPASNGADRA
ncbi:methyltransferase family protein [Lysobacter antibioticus]|nr:class I SAM-dependent methyltransferase [Lysobacter antibioticus]ALN61238.1 methyltransferase family protein [Lysobacter antibioticus]